MKRICQIGCAVLLILLISPVTTGAGNCPEGQKWHDRQGECVKGKKSSSTKSTKVDIKSFKITKPIGLFDVKARRVELAADPKLGDLLCGNAKPSSRAAPAVEVVGHGATYTHTVPNFLELDIRWINRQVDGWLRTGEDAYLMGLRDWMLASAKAGSLTKLVPDPDEIKYGTPLFNLRFMLKPTFVAYDVLRQTDFLRPEEDSKILGWLGPIVKNSDMRGCEGTYQCSGDEQPGEHHTLHDYTTLMMWGAVSGSNYYFQRGVEFYLKSLRALRKNGSSPEVGRKKNRSLLKQNEDVGYLVLMAELAARQGYDLYGVEQRGRSVFTAFEFLLNGIDKPSIVPGGKSQQLTFLYKNYHGDKVTAWFEPFGRARPDHELSQRIRTLIKARRPLTGHAYGGNLSCFFGKRWPEIVQEPKCYDPDENRTYSTSDGMCYSTQHGPLPAEEADKKFREGIKKMVQDHTKSSAEPSGKIVAGSPGSNVWIYTTTTEEKWAYINGICESYGYTKGSDKWPECVERVTNDLGLRPGFK